MNRRFAMFAAVLAVLVGVAVLTQVKITPAPAQEMMGKPKMTGSMSEKVLQDFGSLNLPGVKSVRYMSLVMKPGFRGENIPMEDGTDLCEATRGTITVTLPDGQKVFHKGGDIFVIPIGLKAKLITVDAKVGYVERFWRIVPAK